MHGECAGNGGLHSACMLLLLFLPHSLSLIHVLSPPSLFSVLFLFAFLILFLFFRIVCNGSSIYRTNLTRVLLLVILCTLYQFPFASHDQFLSILSTSPPPSCTLLSVLSHYLLFIFQYPIILLIHVFIFYGFTEYLDFPHCSLYFR